MHWDKKLRKWKPNGQGNWARYDWEDKAKTAYKPGRQSSKDGEQPGLEVMLSHRQSCQQHLGAGKVAPFFGVLSPVKKVEYSYYLSMLLSRLTLCSICIVRRISIVQMRTYMCISVSPPTRMYMHLHTNTHMWCLCHVHWKFPPELNILKCYFFSWVAAFTETTSTCFFL